MESSVQFICIQGVEESFWPDFVQYFQDITFPHVTAQIGCPFPAIAPIILQLGIRRVLKLDVEI